MPQMTILGGRQLLREVTAFAPHRISYCGGGTDFPSFYEEFGGAVISCAVNRYSKIHLKETTSSRVSLEARRVDETYNGSIQDLKNKDRLSMPLRAIIESNRPVEMAIDSDVPPGSGLGSSGTLAINLINALNALSRTQKLNPYELSEKAYYFEASIMNKSVGKQDHYAAAFGGMNFLDFASNSVKVRPFAPDAVRNLHKRSILFYLGVTRLADKILKRQEKRVRERNTTTIESLKGMLDLTRKMKKAIEEEDFGAIGAILEQAWSLKKKYTSGISNKFIERAHSAALEAGAGGAKVTGAGGGGHFLVYAEPEFHRKILKRLTQLGCQHIPYKVSKRGAWVESSR